MKKFFATLMLAVALVIVGSQNNVEAGEQYVGSYGDGTAGYLIKESVKIISPMNGLNFTCTVRAGRSYLNYHFYPVNRRPYYENSEGYSGYALDGSSPVAAAIYRAVAG